ncbi:hypothetical protein SKAU_G00209790 [Synaphobranchus kaupii]|uniref:PiggyBac transposable element-derived protein domain-containing protein n=1 Tax=Synaphobranchus kaupii TaxID=118154 RepID=A0A9Q1F8V5_SYNKA|nr:hypothetical protein SKAU_G00209790 [Synaphobranchus kaupii]
MAKKYMSLSDVVEEIFRSESEGESESGSEAESIDSVVEDAFAQGEDVAVDMTLVRRSKRPCSPSPRGAPKKRPREPEPESEEGWHDMADEDEEPHQFPFCPRRTPGVQLDLQQDYSPLDLFRLFFSKDVLKLLCDNTNGNAARKHAQGLHTPWSDVDAEDMLKYLSIVLYLGLVKPSAARDLWRKDRLHNHPFPCSVMPGYRYEAIGAFLHMSDTTADVINDQLKGQAGYDGLFRLKPLHDQILTACRAYYHPHRNLAIDERMVASKARHGMKQYLKDKPTKWGFKLFVLADSKTGYTCDFSVYQGKALTPSGNGLSFDAVVNLLWVPYLGTGYHVFVDNFYTSTALFRHLHRIHYGACGTIRENRIGFPKTKVNSLPKKAVRGDMRWIRDGPLLYVKWKDTREVSMCSSIHKAYSGKSVQRQARNPDGTWARRVVTIPEPVLEYNKYMGGVDLSDALIKYFSVTQKCRHWYKKLFLHFVDIAVVNSYILHKEMALEKQHKPITQKLFRETLCLQLADCGKESPEGEGEMVMAAAQPQEAAMEQRPEGCFPVAVTNVSNTDPREKATKGRKYCVHCLSLKRRNKTIYKCRSCDVPLCIIADRLCFTEWHDLRSRQAL